MLRIFSIIGAIFFWLHGAAFAGELQINDLKEGTGETVIPGSNVAVHYTGWLMDGKKFDSSRDRGQPFEFSPGGGRVIPGWEQGVLGMKVGGKRELIIPPELGYGAAGAGGVIPPNATLKFEIEVVSVSLPKYSNIDNSTVEKLLKQNIKIIDVRRPEEWKQTGIVEGSHLLTFFDKRGQVNPDFIPSLEKLVKKDEQFILICRTGNRTGAISRFLSEKAGYSGINNVTRGITHWIAQGFPVDNKPEMPEGCWLC